ncbi:MAG TPA: LPXTG cell wall anchor domain-containing protein [Hyphomicrobiaceae bacterium]|jgi:LPXTG-motif cell wall-anchored protein|nr:LPXTG cell wall anchor domain-containing protein [Hyphomicrobiaceae bacterium]
MDQRPRDLPPKSDWDRLPTTDDASWSVLPILIVVALIAVGAWLLFANSGTSPTTTSETAPVTAPSPRPAQPPATTPTTPPANTAPAPATKP